MIFNLEMMRELSSKNINSKNSLSCSEIEYRVVKYWKFILAVTRMHNSSKSNRLYLNVLTNKTKLKNVRQWATGTVKHVPNLKIKLKLKTFKNKFIFYGLELKKIKIVLNIELIISNKKLKIYKKNSKLLNYSFTSLNILLIFFKQSPEIFWTDHE